VSAASLGGDAVAVYHVGEQLPSYFEVQASVKMEKPTGGWKGNAYVVFDYQGEHDFKFAGIDQSTNKLVMGHRDASGWHVDKTGVVTGGVKAGKWYNLTLAVNGINVTLLVDNKQVFQHTFQPRIVEGYAYGLNWGMVGVGSDNARGSFDNIRVQVLPPQVTFDDSDDFSGTDTLEYFNGDTNGVWGVSGGRYSVDPGASLGLSLLDLGPDSLNHNAYLELSAKVKTGDRAGLIFDRYGEDSFKFAAIDADAQKLLIGHYTKKSGWVIDSSVSTTIDPSKDYVLGLTLKGSTVSATLNGANGGFQAIAGHIFNAATVDGRFGLMATGGAASFDDVRVKTDDPVFIEGEGEFLLAEGGESFGASTGVTQAELDAAAAVAMETWTVTLGSGDPRLAAFGGVHITSADLAGPALGYTIDRRITIDSDAAGYGWSSSGMDLVTTVTHELGHVLSLEDDEHGFEVMDGELEAGLSRVIEATGFDADPDRPITDGMLRDLAARAAQLDQGLLAAFDLGNGQAASSSGIDWLAGSGGGWAQDYSPYDANKAKNASRNVSEFFVKVAGAKSEGGASGGYDSLGSAVLGKKTAKPKR
jgi:hypothetical protein